MKTVSTPTSAYEPRIAAQWSALPTRTPPGQHGRVAVEHGGQGSELGLRLRAVVGDVGPHGRQGEREARRVAACRDRRRVQARTSGGETRGRRVVRLWSPVPQAGHPAQPGRRPPVADLDRYRLILELGAQDGESGVERDQQVSLNGTDRYVVLGR